MVNGHSTPMGRGDATGMSRDRLRLGYEVGIGNEMPTDSEVVQGMDRPQTQGEIAEPVSGMDKERNGRGNAGEKVQRLQGRLLKTRGRSGW